MTTFDILDRRLDIHRHYLLEASAGTGKTFSIENIVVRLLIEGDALPLEKILVVTYTRAATRDLKIRIRANIEKALAALNGQTEQVPDYLQAIQESGDVETAIRRLDEALFCFDRAQISTIHGFCARMLRDHVFESDLGLEVPGADENLPNTELLRVIKDFFRTEVRPETYSPAQLGIVLGAHKGQLENLENAILRVVKSGCQIAKTPGFTHYFEHFVNVMKGLKHRSDFIIEDFHAQAGSFKVLKVDASERTARLERFAKLFEKETWQPSDFDQLIRYGLYYVEALDPSLLKTKAKQVGREALHYPDLVELLRQQLYPIVKEARHYGMIFARMCHECQQMVVKYLTEEEKVRPDDFLQNMWKGLQNPEFVDKVRAKYQAAIIDEFQDTDPIQWQIFKKLFLDWGHLYLVGDPKQSIYAFRQADIYTYLSAAKSLGADHRASLDTNYRSVPSLIKSLNILFSVPDLISLPKIGESLPYPEVKACEAITEKAFSDSLGTLHFFIAESENPKKFNLIQMETDFFFPFILQEIQRLHEKDGIAFHQFAILVRDKAQANRMGNYLKEHGMPAALQKNSGLAESSALPAMKELIKAVLHPRNDSLLKTTLGSQIFGWTHDQIRSLEQHEKLEEVLAQFYEWRRQLFDHGFAGFYQSLMHVVAVGLLSQQDGLAFYQDLSHIAELIMEQQSKTQAFPERLLEFLDDFETMETNDEDRIKRKIDPDRKAIQIQTLHSSKGLEYDVVFALGLINRVRGPDDLIPDENQVLTPVIDEQSAFYQKYCQEVDAEKMRQFYVAMTRAKYRLYAPAILGVKSGEPGTASPMELYLEKLDKPLYEFLDCAHIAYTRVNDQAFEKSEKNELNFVELHPPSLIEVPGKPLFVHSFTHLAKRTSFDIHQTISPPHDFNVIDKTPHNMPSGSQTGTILHEILEDISFEKLHDIPVIVAKHVAGTEFVGWEAVFIQIVRNVLQVSLNDGQHSFSLCEIDPTRLYKETEFLYPCDVGFIKGVMDLIFEHNGKYYLLDWKSNWLGPGIESYGREAMEAAMREHDYFLQGALYTEALKRFLRIVDDREFEECFGGIYYLFLRGIDLDVNAGTGVMHFQPHACPIGK